MRKNMNINHKLNRYEAAALHKEQMDHYLHGDGLYVYRNNTSGTLFLPKPTQSGIRHVPVNGEWQGDSYYMALVRNHEARLVRTILSPEQQKEMKMNEQKLILDQPDKITPQGKVEHVISDPMIPLNETTPVTNEKPKNVLINEDPMAGVDILME
jgi:hypothetical protein